MNAFRWLGRQSVDCASFIAPMLCGVIFLFAINSATADAEGQQRWWDNNAYGLDLHVKSITLSEPVPIKANFDDWRTEDFLPGERIYTKHVARAGASVNGYSFGLSKQLYYFLDFSPDTARWHYKDKNDRLDDHKGMLDVYLNANHAQGQGFYVGRETIWRNFTVSARLSYLDLDKVTYGVAQGTYDPVLDLANTTHLTIDYAYTEDRLFKRSVQAPKGKGVTLDVSVDWSWQRHRVAVELEELYSRFSWDAPVSEVTGNLENLSIRKDAALTFSHYRAKFNQHLPVHGQLNYSYHLTSGLYFGAEIERLSDKQWNKAVAGWQLEEVGEAMLKWSPEEGIWGAAIRSRYLSFNIESDKLNLADSRLFKVFLGAAVYF